MRTFTSVVLAFFLTLGTASAQFVLVNSPESIAGSYTFGTGNFGTPLTDSVWTADAIFVDDGSASPTLGCNALINSSELMGKIALADRGACAFSQKALNAQNAGAIAIIIINNAAGAGAMGMAGGDLGPQITIPVASLSLEDGNLIRAALAEGPVNITMGNIIFENDLKVSANNVMYPPQGTVPGTQLKAAGDFVFIPGASASNGGLNDATNVTANLVIEHTPFGGTAEEVYNESLLLAEVLEADSSTVPICFQCPAVALMPSFDPLNTGEGVYTFTYNIETDAEDDVPNDNTISGTFTISPSHYSKASWDLATNSPRITGYTRRGDRFDWEFMSVFNVPYGFGYQIDTIVFGVAVFGAADGLANVSIDAFLYEWNDADGNGEYSNEEVSLAGIAPFSFPENFTETSALLRLPVLDLTTFEEGITIAEDGKNYIVGIRYMPPAGQDDPKDLRLGFDQTQNYLQYWNHRVEIEEATRADFGYWGVNDFIDPLPDFSATYRFTDFYAAVSTGIILGEIESSTNEVVGPEVFEVKLFPNPATEYLQVNLEFKQPTSYVDYVITDMTGRLLFTQRDTEVFDTEQATFNTSQLPAGRYNLTIRTEQGIRTGGFIVKR